MCHFKKPKMAVFIAQLLEDVGAKRGTQGAAVFVGLRNMQKGHWTFPTPKNP